MHSRPLASLPRLFLAGAFENSPLFARRLCIHHRSFLSFMWPREAAGLPRAFSSTARPTQFAASPPSSSASSSSAAAVSAPPDAAGVGPERSGLKWWLSAGLGRIGLTGSLVMLLACVGSTGESKQKQQQQQRLDKTRLVAERNKLKMQEGWQRASAGPAKEQPPSPASPPPQLPSGLGAPASQAQGSSPLPSPPDSRSQTVQ